jgi:type VI secretion system secreted protein VgrG
MRVTKLFDAIYYGGAQRNRLVKLDTPLGTDWLLPMYVQGHARLGRDYAFTVDAVSMAFPALSPRYARLAGTKR